MRAGREFASGCEGIQLLPLAGAASSGRANQFGTRYRDCERD